MIRNNDKAYKIAMTGLMAALSYVVFTFGQIKLTLPGGDATSIHLGNAVCVLGALLIGGFWGGLGGAIGMTIGAAGSGLRGLCAENLYFKAVYRPDYRFCGSQDWKDLCQHR